MTKKRESDIDWSLTTWKGSRLQQHREFLALPFSRKLELIEQMAEFASQIHAAQKTGEPSPAVREPLARYPSKDRPESRPVSPPDDATK
jgi:hypothetical protein